MKPGKKNSYKSLSEIRIDDKKFKFYYQFLNLIMNYMNFLILVS